MNVNKDTPPHLPGIDLDIIELQINVSIDMYIKHPLQRFLDRHGISQSELARAVQTSRETVNRWIRWRNLPAGENLIRTVDFARRFEAGIQADELFPTRRQPGRDADLSSAPRSWGEECAICRVPWSAETEHLPLALLHPEIGSHPVGGLCQACARRTGTDPTVDSASDPASRS